MARVVIAAAAILLAVSVGRADEDKGAAPSQPAPAVKAAPCCEAHLCAKPRHPLVEWLSYRPLTRPGLAGCYKQPVPCCHPPLWMWFVDYCHASQGVSQHGLPTVPCGPGCR